MDRMGRRRPPRDCLPVSSVACRLAVEAGSVCEWVSTTLNATFRGQSVSFKSKIRAAGH